MKRMKPTELLSMDTPSVECEIPQYDCLQDAKTDLVLDQLVQMVHEIKGEIADLREIMTGSGGCNQGRIGFGNPEPVVQPYAEEAFERAGFEPTGDHRR